MWDLVQSVVSRKLFGIMYIEDLVCRQRPHLRGMVPEWKITTTPHYYFEVNKKEYVWSWKKYRANLAGSSTTGERYFARTFAPWFFFLE